MPVSPADPSAMLRSLRRALAAPDAAVRRRAVEHAGSSRLAAAADRAALEDAVAEALADDDALVRAAAIRALVRLGAHDALRPLIRASGEDPSAQVRREAVAALARLVTKGRRR